MFPPTSRYHGIEILKWNDPGGRQIAYLRRRFLPPADEFPIMYVHVVTEGERLDVISAQYLGDPQAFWRLCDANEAMQPAELTAEIGRRLRIPLIQGA